MTYTSRSWRIGLILTACAWFITVALLVVSVAQVEVERDRGLVAATFWLALVAGLVAVVTAAFALRGLRRQQVVERELRRSQNIFQGILTIAADAIITVDEQHRIMHFNNGAETLFGYRADEVRGEPLERLLPDRFRRAHEVHLDGFGQGVQVARRMGERRAIYGLRRDGSEFPAEASISRLEVDGVRVFSVVLRDITERARAEERQRFLARASVTLANSLETEATFVAACHVGVPYLADCAILDIVEAKGEVRRLVSVHDDPERTRVLRRLEGHVSPSSRWPLPLADVLAGAPPVVRRGLSADWVCDGAEDPVRLADWEALGVQAYITVGLRARDRVFGALTLLATDPARSCGDEECAIAVALAERVAVAIDNAALYREARRASQARDELLGIVSHDLRNPLSAISMCSRVLAEKPPEEDAERVELANAILDSVALMQRLIQDLLDVATIESGHLRIAPELADPGDVARRALSMVKEQAGERGVEVEACIPATLRPIRIDAMRIEQVMANLLGNAVKFTNRGGHVTLELSEAPEGLEVSVTDTGIGIPPEAIPHIFDRFWHSRRSGRTVGTGLGLAIAKGIVAAHGGDLAVTSKVGAGSTFTFRLAGAPVPGSPALSSSSSGGQGRAGRTHS